MNEDVLKVSFLTEKFELESALIGGKTNDEHHSPFSVYAGPLDLDEIHEALFFLNRTVLKILIEHFNIPSDQCNEFVFSAVSEAITQEYNEATTGDTSVNCTTVIKRQNKNKNSADDFF